MTVMGSMADAKASVEVLAIPRFENGFVNMQGLLRNLAGSVVNKIVSAEADQMCESTGSNRNGYRERRLVTHIGTQALEIPTLR